MISISKAEHLTSFWNRGPGELGSSILSCPVSCYSPRSLCESYLDPVSLSFLKWRMKRPVSHPEKWGGVGGGGGGGGLFILLVNFTFIWYSYNRSWSQISASFIQGQSANSRKDNDLRSVIQSREDALREVEKLVKHAESLERKYNEKVWMTQAISVILPATLFHKCHFLNKQFLWWHCFISTARIHFCFSFQLKFVTNTVR